MTLNLEGVPLLRYHSGDRAETHNLAEKDPGNRCECAKSDSTPSQIHAPRGSESSGFENAADNWRADHTVFGHIRYRFRTTVLHSLEVNDRQREQRKRS